MSLKWRDIGLGSSNIKVFLLRLGAACPANYNPADHYIQLLAGIPGREETTRHTIDTVCTAFAKSELGCKIAAEAENALYHEVRHLNHLQYFRVITEGHKWGVTQDNTVTDKAQNRKGNILQYIKRPEMRSFAEKHGNWEIKPKRNKPLIYYYLHWLNNSLSFSIFKGNLHLTISSVDCACL